MRYFRIIRVEMFKAICQWIQSYSRDVLVYLGMESDQAWRQTFGWSPGRTSAKLKKLLDARVR